MKKDKLEIALITYNRWEVLQKTLDQLSRGPFKDVKMTLFDNHSSDRTPEICRRYQEKFANLTIVRHGKNIGGGPNFLRAVESSVSTYTWVLCDDDDYDFSDCQDVIDAIENETCDLIWVSDEHLQSWEKGELTTADELMRRGACYYPALSFIPAVIFRTELFDAECLEQGYRLYEFLYPQFPFIHKTWRERRVIYVARHTIINRGWGSTGVAPFPQYASWVKCCITLDDDSLRARVIDDMTAAGGGLAKEIFALIGVQRMDFDMGKQFWKDVSLVWLGYDLRQRLQFLAAFAMAMLLPVRFLRFMREMRYRLRGDQFLEKHFDTRDVYYD